MTSSDGTRPARLADLDEDRGLLPLVKAAGASARDPATVAEIVALGGGLLRRAPLAFGVVLAAAAIIVSLADVPVAQRAWLLGSLGVLEGMLLLASLRVHDLPLGRARALSRLAGSVPLVMAMVVSGGVTSPLAPLVLAPAVGRFAAHGLGRRSLVHCATLCALFAALALLPGGVPFPELPSPGRELLAFVSVAACLAILRDSVAGLTDAYRRAGEELDHLREELLAEATQHARSREAVGAKVAHEIKNPLTAVKGLVQLLATRDDGTGNAERFRAMAREVEHVEAVLKDYLSHSRPPEDLKPVRTDLLALLRDVAALVEARAEAAGATVVVEARPGSAFIDPRRFKETLLSLTEHLLQRAGPGGLIELSAGPAPGGLIELSLESSAPLGLEPVLTRSGELPVSVPDDEAEYQSLTLARAVAAQHGGELSVQSTSGGTKFCFTLPSSFTEERKRDGPDPVG